MSTKNNQVQVMESGERKTIQTETGVDFHDININDILIERIIHYLRSGEIGNRKYPERKSLPGKSNMWIHRISRSGYRLIEFDGASEKDDIDKLRMSLNQIYPGIYHGYVTYGKGIFFIISQSQKTPTNFEGNVRKGFGGRVKNILEGKREI